MTATLLLEAFGAAEPLQSAGSASIKWTRTALLSILGYGLLAGAGALAVAFGYRALTVRKLPAGPAVLVGLALPTGWLTIGAVRQGTVVAESPLLHYTSSVFLLGVVAAGTLAAAGGHRLGDHLACGVFDVRPLERSGPVADLVRSAGLAVAVTLPDTIDDADGYPTVDAARKRELAGRRFLFPSDLSVSELQARLEARIESDFDVGYVCAELDEDGSAVGVAVGDRQVGVSPTLGPDQVAVAIAADPPSRASTGDPVEIWTTGDGQNGFVATGTLRASAGSATTLLVDADDATAFEAGRRYRLTTRPETPSDGHALVSAIRAADETVTVRTVDEGGPLENEFAGWVPGRVLAIERGDEIISLPADREPLEAGNMVYAFGTPVELEAPSSVLEESVNSDIAPEAVSETAE
ncbi:hypothetical protein [Haloterrigena alkaliphila]|uniref:RCK C-terminal domain-containing protein n=1 Tax=Haloterrigena alkaliphila TaxID=2816475 RepID=A0A8A2VHW5_9EURY|nr:hypothetical protein [Haloterrigena alkaliphila]QSX00937.1 hypothetical protein J0X25_08245 [Haloterrigena alkaliphila]